MNEKKVKFNGYSIVDLEMKKADEHFAKKNGELNIETEHYENSEDNKKHKLVMNLKTITKNKIINLKIEGYFQFEGKFESREIEIFMNINACSILYPYCRSIISYLTGLDSEDNILLPIINFSNIKTE